VEAQSRGVERRFGEFPVWRPQAPKQPCDRATILRKARDATLRVKIPLVPVALLLLRRRWAVGSRYILDVVPVDGHEANSPLRPERSNDAGRTSTPVVSNEYRRRDA